MLFREFAELCDRLETISSRLAMIDVLAGVFPSLSEEELPVFVRFMRGKIFPDWSSEKLGVGPGLLYEALAYVIGKKRQVIISTINSSGDIGRVVDDLLEKREQTMFFSEDLELLEVHARFLQMAKTSGRKSQQERMRSAQYLLSNASPLEGRYLSRLMLEEMRIGIGEGVVREAVAKGFAIPAETIEHAHQALNDLGEVALLAKTDPSALERCLKSAMQTIQSCREELRYCLWDLRNNILDLQSLEEAVRQTLRPQTGEAELVVRFPVSRRSVSDNTTHAVLQIVRELAVNAIRHGGATSLRVAGSLEGDTLAFSVQDNGCGFDAAAAPGPEQGHFGLLGVRDRLARFNGTLEVTSAPGKGTRAVVRMKESAEAESE